MDVVVQAGIGLDHRDGQRVSRPDVGIGARKNVDRHVDTDRPRDGPVFGEVVLEEIYLTGSPLWAGRVDADEPHVVEERPVRVT